MQKITTLTIIILILLTTLPIIPAETNNNIFSKSEDNTEYYAIIAACSEYNDSTLNLPKFVPPHPESKLKKFYKTLLKADNWKEENIILLINEKATTENIKDAFNYMSNIVDENDVFLFSWQGHGSKINDISKDEENGFDEVICPYNCYRDEKKIIHNYITDDELKDMFSNINCKGHFIIFDCCYSGGIIKDLNSEKRVLIALTEEDNLGLIDLFIGFPMTSTLSLGIHNGLFKNIKDKDKNGFISAEESYNWCKPILKISTRAWLIESFIMTYALRRIFYKNDPSGEIKALISSVFSTIFSYIISQIIIYKKTGDFAKNSPHMIDNYDGKLDIIQIS